MMALVEIFNTSSDEISYSGICETHPQNIFTQSLFNFQLYSYMKIKVEREYDSEFGLRIDIADTVSASVMDDVRYENFSYMIMANTKAFSLIEIKRPQDNSSYVVTPEEAKRVISNAREILTELNELGDSDSFFEKYANFFSMGIGRDTAMKDEFLFKRVTANNARKRYSEVIRIKE